MATLSTMVERLQLARDLGGVSARELGLLAGMAHSAVGWIERSSGDGPTSKSLERIVGVLGVSLDWLVLGKGNAPEARDVRAAVARARRRAQKSAA